MAIFYDFLPPVFAASRVQHVSDLHLKFALRPHHVSRNIMTVRAHLLARLIYDILKVPAAICLLSV